MTVDNPHRHNIFLAIGTFAPWTLGVAFCLLLRNFFPNEHPLEISSLKVTAVFLFLSAGGVAIGVTTGGWLGNLVAAFIAAVTTAITVSMLLSVPVEGFAFSRWPRIVTAEAVMVATIWSAVFGWLAAWHGDRRLAATLPAPTTA